MRIIPSMLACSAAFCLSLTASQAFALGAQCGNGCSSNPDAPGKVHCTDWEPTIDINNTQGKCQAIKTCVAGSCSVETQLKPGLGFSAKPGSGLTPMFGAASRRTLID